jgi:hypothetical protein
MLIESTPRKPIDTRIFVNELNEVVEFIKGALATILTKKLYVLEIKIINRTLKCVFNLDLLVKEL